MSCNPNYFQSLSAMPRETVDSAVANTCVFWDVDDCPIPEDIDPNSIYRNIKSALANDGYRGNVEFKVYGRDEKLADGYQLDAGVTFVPKVTKHVRVMLFHIYEWAMVNPRGSNLLLISKINREELKLISTVRNLAHRRFNVFLASPCTFDFDLLQFTPRSVWLWTTLLKGGRPIKLSGTKRKSSGDTVTDSDFSKDHKKGK